MISIGGGSQIPSVQKLSNTYELLAVMIDDHSAMLIKDKDRFQNYISDYFAYERIKVENIVGLINRRNEFATAYDKKSGNHLRLTQRARRWVSSPNFPLQSSARRSITSTPPPRTSKS